MCVFFLAVLSSKRLCCNMDSDQGKLFIGGISSEITEERLKDYFKRFGDVLEAEIKKDRITGRVRGFGFVVFADPAVADRVLFETHNIDGRMVEVKKAISRDEQHSISMTRNRSNTAGNGNHGQSRTKKIFVGGLAPTVTENDMRNYFQQFGTVTDAFVMYDPRTKSPRGFGFIVYDSENAVDFVVQNPFHQLNGKMVEVKRAFRKVFSGGPIRLPAGTGREGNFGASNVHGFNSTPVPPMNTGYGYSSDGLTGYNTPSYGTGAGYGPGFTGGGYDNTTFMNNNPSYGTGSYVGAPVSYGGPVAYEVSNAGNGGLYGNNATHTPGSNMWIAPAMAYGNTDSFVGHGGISQYGATQVDNEQSNGSGAGYAAQNSGYEMGVTRYS